RYGDLGLRQDRGVTLPEHLGLDHVCSCTKRACVARSVAPEQAILPDVLLMDEAAVDEEVDREGPGQRCLRLDRIRPGRWIARDDQRHGSPRPGRLGLRLSAASTLPEHL